MVFLYITVILCFLVISESVQVLTLIIPYHHQLEPIIPQRVIKLLFCNP